MTVDWNFLRQSTNQRERLISVNTLRTYAHQKIPQRLQREAAIWKDQDQEYKTPDL